MIYEDRANKPLWLDLLLISAAVATVFGVERYLAPPEKTDRKAAPLKDFASEADDKKRRCGPSRRGTARSDANPALAGARSYETGRGRKARYPHQIPAKGWMDVSYRVYAQIAEDRLLAVAAGAVFYMLLALFPALTALVSLYGLFTDPSAITAQLSLLHGVLPASTIGIIREQVTQLAQTSSGSLSFGFVFGLGLALWSANAGMKGVIDALNIVYDEREKRSFIKLTLVAFAFTIGALAFILFALAAIVVLPLVLAWIGVETQAGLILSWLRWPALLIVALVWLALLYRYGPSREKARWRWLTVGSAFAAVTWLVGSALFSWYLSNFANYDATYGSLGTGIGLMMWLWISVIVVLVGGEINAELEHQTAEDTTTPPEKPLGERGATMADTVGEAWR